MDIPLTSGAYSAESYIASAQRSVNLFPEKNPDSIKPAAPVTHYMRPGNGLLAAPPVPGRGRCLFGATNGDLFAAIDTAIYWITPDWVFKLLGNLVNPGNTPVRMSDNGKTVLIVDGSASGNTIDITSVTRAMAILGDPNFDGADWVDYIDSFLVFNNPGTNQWFSTTSGVVVPFNPLFVGVKTAWPDNVIAVITVGREVWVIGPKKSEIWYNAGTVPFPFQASPGLIIEQGCIAKYSPAKQDVNAYWLSQSPEGSGMVVRVNKNHVAQRISTHAIENEFKGYARLDDAIGSTYQVNGHSFYKLHFPTADKTWGYDEATEQWHEDNWMDNNGILHRARNTFCAYAYGKNVGLDWANGNLYEISEKIYTDNGALIPCIRSFPHVVDELRYTGIAAIVADVESGKMPNTGEVQQLLSPFNLGFSSGFGPLTAVPSPHISLRISKNGGVSYGNNRLKGLMSSGHYRPMHRWRGLGLSRDWVFELSWAFPGESALNGAFITPIEGGA